ncbi:MAG TPA: response regulator transcription factor [Candidatus Limnocylindrales bacterium]|nr:response regulator transcription factor [Candidatus Limnocylindrales bacterium]
MGAVAKNPIPQLVPLATGQSSRPFIADSASPARTIGMTEAQRLSQFVPVIVLVPAAAATSANLPGVAAQKISPIENAGAALLLQFLENAVPQSQGKRIPDSLAFGDVRLNFSSMEATRKGRPVALTSLEFKTLKYLAENPRRVVSRDELLNKVWGYENYPCTRTVDNLVLRLRQKLEKEPSRPAHFHTVHGVGYRFLP